MRASRYPPQSVRSPVARLAREVVADDHERGRGRRIPSPAKRVLRHRRRRRRPARPPAPRTRSSASAGPRTISAAGRPSAVRPGRDDRRAQVEQVAEVRVVAERGVGGDRVREHLVDGERRAQRRQHQHVHLLPQPGDLGPQLAQAVLGGEDVDGGVSGAAREDRPDHRQHRARAVGQEVAELGEPLRHPRPLVQQLPGGEERPERRARRALEGALDPAPGRQVGPAHRFVTEELQLGHGRQTDSEADRVGEVAAARPGVGISPVVEPATTSKTPARSEHRASRSG